MKRVLLVGAFGQGNVGDEALLEVFLAELGSHEVVVATRDPGRTAAVHRCRTVPADDASRVFAATRWSDAVVVAGGTVFKTLRPATGRPPLELLRNAFLLAKGARILGKRLALVGVGAAELDTLRARALARRIANSCDLLVVRDEESAAILSRAGARPPFRIGADPSWVLYHTGTPASPAVEPRDAVLVALSHLAGGSGLVDWLATALRPLGRDGIRVQVQPWQTHPGPAGDGHVAEGLVGELGGDADLLPAPADLADASRTFAGVRLVCGLRFHSLVAAAGAGTPFVAVGHEPKLLGLARRLGQRAVPPGVESALLTKAVATALGSSAPGPAAVRAEIDHAREGLRLLGLLLAEGRIDDAEMIEGLPMGPSPWLD